VILHIASFRWKDEVAAGDVTDVTAALREMAAGIPELRSYVCGENLRVRPGVDFGVAALVDDETALVAYLDSPAHKDVYDRFLSWMIADRSAVQLWVDEGATL